MITFYILLLTQTVSLIGSRMTTVGVGIWVYSQTGSATPLLLASFFAELPGMLGGSLAGVFVDRWPRRLTLVLSDAGQAGATILLLASFMSGNFQVWHLYLISFIEGVFSSLQQPAQDATIALMVKDDRRERANAIREMAFPLAGVMAPVLAGLVYAWQGIAAVIAVDLATFVAAVVVVALIRLPQVKVSLEGATAQGNFWSEMRGGLRYLWARPALLAFILYMTLSSFLLNGPLELTIPYLLAITGSEQTMGWIMGLMSLGALSGAGLIAAWGGTRPRIYTLLAGGLLTGFMFLAYAVVRQPILLGVVIFLLFVPLPIGNALMISIVQAKTPTDLQGRVFAIINQLAMLGSTSSFLLTGPLVDRWLEPLAMTPAWAPFEPLLGSGAGAGMALVLFVTGLAILASTLFVLLWPLTRRLESTIPDYQD